MYHQVENFIKSYLNLVVAYPEKIKLSIMEMDTNFREIIIVAQQEDVGRIIGKKGLLISSLKNLLDGCKAKGWGNFRITVKSFEEVKN